MPDSPHDNSQRIKDALKVYFAKYHFKNGGYDEKYFRIKFGPLFIPFPNTSGRIAAVKFHDIHHVLTGYTALWKGETEIGAWELASGCGHFTIAWLLNFGSFGVGLLLFPGPVFRAFMAGRKTTTNLYHNYRYTELLLDKTVDTLRKELGIGIAKKNVAADYLYFGLACVAVFTATGSGILFFCGIGGI